MRLAHDYAWRFAVQDYRWSRHRNCHRRIARCKRANARRVVGGCPSAHPCLAARICSGHSTRPGQWNPKVHLPNRMACHERGPSASLGRVEWSRGELNPRPEIVGKLLLHACSVIWFLCIASTTDSICDALAPVSFSCGRRGSIRLRA